MEVKEKQLSKKTARTDFLKEKIVIVRYIPKPTKEISNPSHVAYGRKLQGTFDYISPPRLRKDVMKNVLTDKEKAGLEAVMDRDLSIYGDFWKAYRKGGIFPIALGKDPLYLNLGVAEDFIKWKVLFNTAIVANSMDQIKNEPRATYRYVMVEEDQDDKIKALEVGDTAKAYAFYAIHAANEDALRYILRAVGKPTHRGQNMEFLTQSVGDAIKDISSRSVILKLSEDDLFEIKVLLEKAVSLGVIDLISDQYYTKEREPIAGLDEEPTLHNAAKFLSVKIGTEMRQAIEARMKIAKGSQ